MKKEITGIALILILISSSLTLSVEAGSEENPEIKDETGEVLSYVDIDSVWFCENPDEPEYLYVNMKLTNYKIFRILQSFEVYFRIDNESYQVILWKYFFPKLFYTFRHITSNGWGEDDYIYGIVNKIDSIISWKIPKSLIKDHEVGEHISDINATSIDMVYINPRLNIPTKILYFVSKIFNISYLELLTSNLSIMEKLYGYFQDVINYATDYAISDKDYIIQY